MARYAVGQEIGAAAGQVKQAADSNRKRGRFAPRFDESVNQTEQESPKAERVKYHSLLEIISIEVRAR